jgi:hypothetical protein
VALDPATCIGTRLGAIISTGRQYGRRHFTGLAGLGVSAAAVGTNLVKTGTYYMSSPQPPTGQRRGADHHDAPGSAHRMVPAPSGPAPSQVQQMAAHTATVMNPAAIPAGTEPFFGYSNRADAVYTNLICTSSYTCTSNP